MSRRLEDAMEFEVLDVEVVEEYSYFHPGITRQQAEALLVNVGDFLLRTASTGGYSLSLLDTDRVHHYQISNAAEGGFRIQFAGQSMTFPRISELIEYFSTKTSLDGTLLATPVAYNTTANASSDYSSMLPTRTPPVVPPSDYYDKGALAASMAYRDPPSAPTSERTDRSLNNLLETLDSSTGRLERMEMQKFNRATKPKMVATSSSVEILNVEETPDDETVPDQARRGTASGGGAPPGSNAAVTALYSARAKASHGMRVVGSAVASSMTSLRHALNRPAPKEEVEHEKPHRSSCCVRCYKAMVKTRKRRIATTICALLLLALICYLIAVLVLLLPLLNAAVFVDTITLPELCSAAGVPFVLKTYLYNPASVGASFEDTTAYIYSDEYGLLGHTDLTGQSIEPGNLTLSFASKFVVDNEVAVRTVAQRFLDEYQVPLKVTVKLTVHTGIIFPISIEFEVPQVLNGPPAEGEVEPPPFPPSGLKALSLLPANYQTELNPRVNVWISNSSFVRATVPSLEFDVYDAHARRMGSGRSEPGFYGQEGAYLWATGGMRTANLVPVQDALNAYLTNSSLQAVIRVADRNPDDCYVQALLAGLNVTLTLNSTTVDDPTSPGGDNSTSSGDSLSINGLSVDTMSDSEVGLTLNITLPQFLADYDFHGDIPPIRVGVTVSEYGLAEIQLEPMFLSEFSPDVTINVTVRLLNASVVMDATLDYLGSSELIGDVTGVPALNLSLVTDILTAVSVTFTMNPGDEEDDDSSHGGSARRAVLDDAVTTRARSGLRFASALKSSMHTRASTTASVPHRRKSGSRQVSSLADFVKAALDLLRSDTQRQAKPLGLPHLDEGGIARRDEPIQNNPSLNSVNVTVDVQSTEPSVMGFVDVSMPLDYLSLDIAWKRVEWSLFNSEHIGSLVIEPFAGKGGHITLNLTVFDSQNGTHLTNLVTDYTDDIDVKIDITGTYGATPLVTSIVMPRSLPKKDSENDHSDDDSDASIDAASWVSLNMIELQGINQTTFCFDVSLNLEVSFTLQLKFPALELDIALNNTAMLTLNTSPLDVSLEDKLVNVSAGLTIIAAQQLVWSVLDYIDESMLVVGVKGRPGSNFLSTIISSIDFSVELGGASPSFNSTVDPNLSFTNNSDVSLIVESDLSSVNASLAWLLSSDSLTFTVAWGDLDVSISSSNRRFSKVVLPSAHIGKTSSLSLIQGALSIFGNDNGTFVRGILQDFLDEEYVTLSFNGSFTSRANGHKVYPIATGFKFNQETFTRPATGPETGPSLDDGIKFFNGVELIYLRGTNVSAVANITLASGIGFNVTIPPLLLFADVDGSQQFANVSVRIPQVQAATRALPTQANLAFSSWMDLWTVGNKYLNEIPVTVVVYGDRRRGANFLSQIIPEIKLNVTRPPPSTETPSYTAPSNASMDISASVESTATAAILSVNITVVKELDFYFKWGAINVEASSPKISVRQAILTSPGTLVGPLGSKASILLVIDGTYAKVWANQLYNGTNFIMRLVGSLGSDPTGFASDVYIPSSLLKNNTKPLQPTNARRAAAWNPWMTAEQRRAQEDEAAFEASELRFQRARASTKRSDAFSSQSTRHERRDAFMRARRDTPSTTATDDDSIPGFALKQVRINGGDRYSSGIELPCYLGQYCGSLAQTLQPTGVIAGLLIKLPDLPGVTFQLKSNLSITLYANGLQVGTVSIFSPILLTPGMRQLPAAIQVLISNVADTKAAVTTMMEGSDMSFSASGTSAFNYLSDMVSLVEINFDILGNPTPETVGQLPASNMTLVATSSTGMTVDIEMAFTNPTSTTFLLGNVTAQVIYGHFMTGASPPQRNVATGWLTNFALVPGENIIRARLQLRAPDAWGVTLANDVLSRFIWSLTLPLELSVAMNNGQYSSVLHTVFTMPEQYSESGFVVGFDISFGDSFSSTLSNGFKITIEATKTIHNKLQWPIRIPRLSYNLFMWDMNGVQDNGCAGPCSVLGYCETPWPTSQIISPVTIGPSTSIVTGQTIVPVGVNGQIPFSFQLSGDNAMRVYDQYMTENQMCGDVLNGLITVAMATDGCPVGDTSCTYNAVINFDWKNYAFAGTDSCGQFAITGCTPTFATPSFSYSGTVASTNMVVRGSASTNSNKFPITLTDGASDVGGMWFNSLVNVRDSWRATFAVKITDGISWLANPAGEGFAFVIQNNANGLNALGSAGGSSDSGCGYKGLTNSIAVYFDSMNCNEMYMLSNGVITPNFTSWSTPAEFDAEDVTTQFVVTYDADGHRMSVATGGRVSNFDFDIDRMMTLNSGRAYVGMTAATGSYYASGHIVSLFSFEQITTDSSKTTLDGYLMAPYEFAAGYLHFQARESCNRRRVTGGDTFIATMSMASAPFTVVRTFTKTDPINSITDLGTGLYRINFQSAPPRGRYDIRVRLSSCAAGTSCEVLIASMFMRRVVIED
ncbi:hypothetical protein CAOG_02284 [Capsaspora owczarzaki ATCC 30864]|uniref:SH2 domain-containing protein n=1 Tax=Capsaspora owczarzaki (strain ATCC 30864) TaxID=595528 RepID=A0A0D2U7K9_CAPO3|nr:hypothetical protein CAOG_02284 [Capsaspora owczarzaki ATCC 30864]KJE91096.1 hypothetical protein CAOG_002284 [Capsaspora owczarzaki ATCC 30864]|eukprot:XP_004349034.1 hypothetical protein CAOG_02284 [Capsaspora owczarzaki ATCC 30864]